MRSSGVAMSDLRSFALSVYEVDGVPSAALLIQDRCDVDVNVLLLAAYVGAVRGCAVDFDDIAAVRNGVAAWQREVVVPLRTVRTRLKTGPSPAPSAETAKLRERVKALELDAELIELDVLSSFVASRDFPPALGDTVNAAVTAMTTVTGTVSDDDVKEAISVIAAAAANAR